MSDYSKTTNFTAKDALASGDPLKLVKGSEHDTEYNNIETHMATKYDSSDTNLADIVALAVTDGNIIVGDGTNFVAESGATARTSLGLTIGTDVQAFDADLSTLAALGSITNLTDLAVLTPTDSNILVGDGTNFVLESGATARTSLGLTIGTDVQAHNADLDMLAALSSITNLTDLAGLAVTDGNFIVGNGTNFVAESGATVRASLELATSDGPVTGRNTVISADALSQAGSDEGGSSSKIYTGDGNASNAIATGVDMSTGDFGGLVWAKDRDAATSHYLVDTVRGVNEVLKSDSTAAEVTDVNSITAFSSTGYTVGSTLNSNTVDYAGWTWQTNKKKTGTTNRNKAYTCHYNTELGFSIVGFEGDGVDGHEIPHHLGKVPELSIIKNRDTVNQWLVKSSLFGNDDYVYLDLSSALATNTVFHTIMDNQSMSLPLDARINGSTNNHIQYNFTSVAGVSKIGKYSGNGASGNYVDCGFKPAFVLIKNLGAAIDWQLFDAMRPFAVYPNSSVAEGSITDIEFTENGFVNVNTTIRNNSLNNEFLFMAFPESSIDASKAITNYTLPTNADQLAVANPTVMTFANGFDSSGNIDTQEEVLGATLTYGVGYEDDTYYIYRDKDTSWGSTNVRPLTGLTRDTADYSGVVSPSDSTLRTTARHNDYESETGSVLASGEFSAAYTAWQAFNKDNNDIITPTDAYWMVPSTTNSWLQYKHTEKRVLKSWRLRSYSGVTYNPRRFTIEGSNDGLNWTAIDSTYTASDYVGTASLWGDLQDTSANTTAYLYHRINITANNGQATYTIIIELELNTKIASDYYLIDEAEIYNDAGTRLDRVYIGEMKTDTDGNVISYTNYAAGKQQLNEIEVHGALKVFGDIQHNNAMTAWVIADLSIAPPLIYNSYNVKDLVDIATGQTLVVFENKMDTTNYIINGIAQSGVMVNCSNTKQSLHSARVDTVIYTGAGSDAAYAMITFYGGKEIK